VALRHQLRAVSDGALLPRLRAYGGWRVALAFACTVSSFLTLGALEVVALKAAGARRVPRGKAVVTAFVSHAFSQSVGVALLSGAAVRIRAYATDAADGLTVTRVTALVTATVSAGLLLLASIALVGAPPVDLGIPYRPIGMLVMSIVVLFLAWSLLGRRRPPARERSWFHLPPQQTAAALIALSVADWILTAAVLFVLLPPSPPLSYLPFVSAYLVAQTAGMLSHVPGGAGVFEATILSLLAPAGSDANAGLVASLVVYRVVYYLVPLGGAILIAAIVEGRRAQVATSLDSYDATVPLPPRLKPPLDEARGGPELVEGPDTTNHESTPEWLIDNAEGYDRMLQAIASARRSVWMTQLAFDADCIAYAKDDSAPAAGGTILAESLVAAVVRAPIDVRILLNATLLLDTARPLRRFFAARLAALNPILGTLRVRGLSRFPQLLHCKMVIVDGREAFLLGSPFANGYWDDPRHRPVDTRRPLRELGGRPLHDVSLRLTGGPVADLERIFAELWNVAASDTAPDLIPGSIDPAAGESNASARPGDSPGVPAGVPVRIVCTSPARLLPGARSGETQIIDALLEGIAGARSLIYVEHQYLSARPVVSALTQALDREPELELILVLNQNPDVTAYQRWQNARLAEAGLLQHPRAGVFALWTVARDGIVALNQVFVHSKVVVVDDRWATSGSANLDGVSLYSYGDDFTGAMGRRIFRNVRNVDVNVVVNDGAVRGSRARTVADLRARLWSEHLELPVESLAQRPPGGWLPLWRGCAAANVAALARPDGADEMRGFVLPYSARRTPALQLIDLGVHVDPARIDVRFNPGWLEVQFSPNWVRNMFV